MYAIIRTGGKQYRVEPQQVIEVEKLPVEVGSTIEVTDVLMVSDDGNVLTGQPLVEGARVVAEVLDHGRDTKIIVFKYKNKTRYRRRRGHRQPFTRLAIRNILRAGETAAAPAPAEKLARPRRTRPQRATAAAPMAAAAQPTAPTTPRRRTPAAAPAAPRRRTTRKTESEK